MSVHVYTGIVVLGGSFTAVNSHPWFFGISKLPTTSYECVLFSTLLAHLSKVTLHLVYSRKSNVVTF